MLVSTVLAIGFGVLSTMIPQARATVLTVTTTEDELNSDGDCSLREAIQAANRDTAVDACPAGSGADEIRLPAGTYTLTIPGTGEVAGATGDLNIFSDLTLTGAGADTTIVQACAPLPPATTCTGIDRVFEIHFSPLVTMRGLTIRYGTDERPSTGGGGGGIFATGALTLINTHVSGNTASGAGAFGGGGIFSLGPLTLLNSTVDNNRASRGDGGGIFTFGPLTLIDSMVRKNTAQSGGGGIADRGGLLVISSTIRENTAHRAGGLLTTAGGSLTDSTVSGNRATADAGGIFGTGPNDLTLTQSTVSHNTAGTVGGGMAYTWGDLGRAPVLTLINSTVSTNHADIQGGGIANATTGTPLSSVVLKNTTITQNTAPQGGGIIGPHVTMHNTLLAGNTANDCDNTGPTSQGHNLLGTNTNCTFLPTTGDLVGTAACPIDPRLGPLADNGGPTLTHALLPRSPAINAGNPSPPGSGDLACEATDQRGGARPFAGRCDMGAVEIGTDGASPLVPIAQAGPDQTVAEGDLVTLDGSGSSDLACAPLTYTWQQLSGSVVALHLTDPVHPTFRAPAVPPGGTTLTFQLTVHNGHQPSAPDTVDVTVKDVNHPPVAEAGSDQRVSEAALVTLDGAASFDPDTDALTVLWEQTAGPLVTLSDPQAIQPVFTAPLVGSTPVTLTFRLTVRDGQTSASDTVQVVVEPVNHPPIADAGADQTVDEGRVVQLDGSGSQDPDADLLTFQWTQVAGPRVPLNDAAARQPTFTAPAVSPGGVTLTFALTVHDGELPSAPDTVTITVRDLNDPPTCALAQATPAVLWPPNHTLVPITIVGVSDPQDHQVTLRVTHVMQDEPVNGLGDGDTSPDAVVQASGLVVLRAERAGSGNGRVYQVGFMADDGQGGTCRGTVRVCVPHDQRPGSTCVDEGPVFNSLLP